MKKFTAPPLPGEPLTAGTWVKIMPGKTPGTFSVRTTRFGDVLGPRLCKSAEPIPDVDTENLEWEEAVKVFDKWEAYRERQEVKRKR